MASSCTETWALAACWQSFPALLFAVGADAGLLVVQVEGYSEVYDGSSMLFMDFRRHHSGVWAGAAPRCIPHARCSSLCSLFCGTPVAHRSRRPARPWPGVLVDPWPGAALCVPAWHAQRAAAGRPAPGSPPRGPATRPGAVRRGLPSAVGRAAASALCMLQGAPPQRAAVPRRGARGGRLRAGEHPAGGEGLWGTGREAPSFLYAMPVSGRRVFLEETCLVAKPAVPFATLKRRLHRRLAAMGLKARAGPACPRRRPGYLARRSPLCSRSSPGRRRSNLVAYPRAAPAMCASFRRRLELKGLV